MSTHLPLVSNSTSFMSIEIEEDEPILKPCVKDDQAKNKKMPRIIPVLKTCMNDFHNNLEIGVDEAGRGPLFGRVYSGAVILPKDNSFDHSLMKDSKKFHSKNKIREVAEYIKANAISWGVGFSSESVIDEINILQATQQSMHKAIDIALQSVNKTKDTSFNILVDGNYFKPYVSGGSRIPHVTVEQGDNTYSSIAAASILAKVARDQYIDELCEEHPFLAENYGIDSNKGYGSKKHLDGIKEHGITIWHRRTFGICKNYH
jgi:ribonuclease HII